MDLSLQTVELGSLKAKILLFHLAAVSHTFALCN